MVYAIDEFIDCTLHLFGEPAITYKLREPGKAVLWDDQCRSRLNPTKLGRKLALGKLCATLAMRRSGYLTRDEIFASMKRSTKPDTSNLGSTVFRIRNMFRDAAEPKRDGDRQGGSRGKQGPARMLGLQFDLSRLSVDVWHFKDAVKTAQKARQADDHGGCCQNLVKAVKAFDGGPQEPVRRWIPQEARMLAYLFGQVVSDLVELNYLDALADPAQTLGLAVRLLGSELDSPVCDADAAEMFDRLRSALSRYAPSEPDGPENMPPPLFGSIDPPPAFVPRAQVALAVHAVLQQGRIVTVTGLGGSGKTEVAKAVARRMRRNYNDGLAMVEIEHHSLFRGVAEEVASLVGVPYTEGLATKAILDFLRDKQFLLVLDACEFNLHGCAELALVLLASCPALTILATSQEPLGIDREQKYRLPLLTIPPRGKVTDTALGTYEAPRLFAQWASMPDSATAHAHAPVQIPRGKRQAIARICRRLDGHALALRLAAGWVGDLTVCDIARELSRPGIASGDSLLSGGPAQPVRHESLQATMAWSFNHLKRKDARLVTLLRRLTVFAGSASADAVARVCRSADLRPVEIVDLRRQLVRHSLLEVENVGGQERFRILDLVRRFAAEDVDRKDMEDLEQHHALFFIERVTALAKEPSKIEDPVLLASFAAEHADLRKAFKWLLGRPVYAEEAIEFATALARFLSIRGHRHEAHEQLGRALSNAQMENGRPVAPMVEAEGYVTWGLLALELGRANDALQRITHGLDIYKSISADQITNLMEYNNKLATAKHYMGRALGEGFARYSEAHRWLDEAQRLNRHIENRGGEAYNIQGRGNLAYIAGDLQAALADYAASRELFKDVKNARKGLAFVYCKLGNVQEELGEVGQAYAYLHQALTDYRPLEDSQGIGLCLLGVAALAMRAGRLEDAGVYAGAGTALFHHVDADKDPIFVKRCEHIRHLMSSPEDADVFERGKARGQRRIPRAWREIVDQALAFTLSP